MFDLITITLATGLEAPMLAAILATSAASAAAGGMQAHKANKDAKRSQQAAREAAIHGMREQGRAGMLERQKLQNRAHLIRSRLRVSAGEAGLTSGTTYSAMLRQADFDARANQAVADRNTAGQILGTQYQTMSQVANLESRKRNVAIDTTSGAVRGGSSGLSLGLGLKQAGVY